ncbi:hypothetical protein ASD13_01415 [Microbacterium sp. Root1433D1]|uniref:HdeD family acid-resistance protein n=1 Tax=Microbacterium TaxID=33882 RepID=UPI0006F1EC3B|nr:MULTISPECIES: DUF308 domain-containing protein [Microbacterium]KQY77375.1 hypothetical protein ASD13_01415 [Microbacterium sp. Root1433D1]WKT89469.1 DUF308 domain-containing protein [Microbacterium liquefaciens]
MNGATTTAKSPFDGIRVALGIGGLLALAVGVVILVWPGKTAMVVTALVAAYVMIAGVIYAAIGGLSSSSGAWARVGHVLLGLVFVVAGVIAFTSLSQTAAWLGTFLGVLLGILWIVEGVVALSTLPRAGSKVWSVVFSIFSIAAGALLLVAPLWGATVLWMLMGISLMLLGVVNIVRAISLGRRPR